ncbi:MFS transporter [Gilliamella sp. wkB171]|uniref:MFS transporter n=1 Tax=Gilliamella sp. wkB171 TaxID=3120258 RepID=UPI0008138BCB|nr:MFS transporter [Gilliamella apicola]OCL28733.1 hypothetical protein A9G03_01810 [Gilliamella apicola]
MNSRMTSTQRLSNKMSIIISALLIMLLVGSVYITQLIFQEISINFNIEILDARLVFSLSCFFYALAFFIYGPLSDKLSTRLLVTFGSLGTVLCLCIANIVTSFNLYLIVMSLIGFFAASVPAALFAYTAKNTDNAKLSQAMGMLISASIVGMIFSRSLAAMLTDIYSWKVAFGVYACLILIVTIFIPSAIKPTLNNTPKISIIETYQNASKLLFNRTVIIFLLVGFLLFFVYLGLSSLLTFYLKGSPFYLTSTELGWLNFAGISAIIGSIITGKLAQIINKNNLLILLLLCVSASIIIIGFGTNLLMISLGIFCLFMFVFGIQPIVMAMLNQIVPLNLRGAVSSLYLLACLIGGSLGTYLLGSIYQQLNWFNLIIAILMLTILNVALALLGIKLIKIKQSNTQTIGEHISQ